MSLNHTAKALEQETYDAPSEASHNVTDYVNVTSSKMASTPDIHLWLPYVVLTLVLVAMAVASFVKYHYKNKLKYREKSAKMKTNQPFRKYRVKLGGRGLSEGESKCDGHPVQNGISLCRSESKGSNYRKWMDLDVKSFAQNHTNDLMVKQSPAHSQALAYAYNNPTFETSDCDVINSDYDVPTYNDVTDAADITDIEVTELNSSDDNTDITDNTEVPIDEFLRKFGIYTEYEQSDNDDAFIATQQQHVYPRDSSTGYGTSTMVNSGDSFGMDTDTGTECGTISTINPSNRDSFVSFDSDQTYDARSQEARMAGYNSLGDLSDGVARVFVNEYDLYHTDTDNIDTDVDRHIDTDNNNDLDTDNESTITPADNSIQDRDIEAEMKTKPRSMNAPDQTEPFDQFDGVAQYLPEGASYDLPTGVRNRNQDIVHVTAL